MSRPLGVPEVRWERMFPDELEAAFERCPVLYLPYGLCEPHGPQSALGCDGLRAHAICRRAATAHGGVVAPPHYWHIHESGGFGIWASRKVGEVARPWLTAVPPWLFFKTICYHVRAADQLGFRAAVLYSGHGGPHAEDVARFVELIQPRIGARLAFVVEGDDLKDPSSPFAYAEWADHAGKGETSQLWAVEPDAVDRSRLPGPDEPARISRWIPAPPSPPGAAAMRCCATRPPGSAAWPPVCWPSTSGSPRSRGSSPTPRSSRSGPRWSPPSSRPSPACRTATARSRPTPAGTPTGGSRGFYDGETWTPRTEAHPQEASSASKFPISALLSTMGTARSAGIFP